MSESASSQPLAALLFAARRILDQLARRHPAAPSTTPLLFRPFASSTRTTLPFHRALNSRRGLAPPLFAAHIQHATAAAARFLSTPTPSSTPPPPTPSTLNDANNDPPLPPSSSPPSPPPSRPAWPPMPPSSSFRRSNRSPSSTSTSVPPSTDGSSAPDGGTSSTPGAISSNAQNRTLHFAFAGNLSIALLKLFVFALTSSQAMFAEFVHTSIDSLNQGLLLFGARETARQPDFKHQMGYGKAAFFWSLISAMNMFWMGCCFTTWHTLTMSAGADELTSHWYTWVVLSISLAIDGAVLRVALLELYKSKPPGTSLWKHFKRLKNPLVLATIYEDVVAVSGVLLAATGIALSNWTGTHFWDHAASISIAAMLGVTSLMLMKQNYRFLLGFSINPSVQHSITQMILRRPSVTQLYEVRCEWMSSDSFAFRAEVDFDGAYFAKQLDTHYKDLFLAARPEEISSIMVRFADDVTLLVEQEVVAIEEEIRSVYPQAAFIELEPASDTSIRSSSVRPHSAPSTEPSSSPSSSSSEAGRSGSQDSSASTPSS